MRPHLLLAFLCRRTYSTKWSGCETLKTTDKELWNLLCDEKKRQVCTLDLIASENFVGRGVLECLGSALSNKYAEGYPGSRYYRGNEIVDKIELLAQSRLLDLFGLKNQSQTINDTDWGVNVQPYSGSPANMAAYTALLRPHDRMMGLHMLDGGHVTHGFQTATKKISSASIFFESLPYRVDPRTELIDYDALERDAHRFNPKLIVAGISAYPRVLDYARFRKICDSVGAILLADMAHVSGLVAGRVIPSPFEHAHIVTSTTHKTLRGPRAGMIFYRRNDSSSPQTCRIDMERFENNINDAVYPALQGGPHQNAIAGIAATALEANTEAFQSYSSQTLKNSQALANALQHRGFHIVSGGTDVHFVLVNLPRSPGKSGLVEGDGARVQLVADLVGITLNQITVPGDTSLESPSGLRLGTPALTSRGFSEVDFEKIAGFLEQVVDITILCSSMSRNLHEFHAALHQESDVITRLNKLREEVTAFSSEFPMPGWDDF